MLYLLLWRFSHDQTPFTWTISKWVELGFDPLCTFYLRPQPGSITELGVDNRVWPISDLFGSHAHHMELVHEWLAFNSSSANCTHCVYSPQLVWLPSNAPRNHLFTFVVMGHRDVWLCVWCVCAVVSWMIHIRSASLLLYVLCSLIAVWCTPQPFVHFLLKCVAKVLIRLLPSGYFFSNNFCMHMFMYSMFSMHTCVHILYAWSTLHSTKGTSCFIGTKSQNCTMNSCLLGCPENGPLFRIMQCTVIWASVALLYSRTLVTSPQAP